MEDYRDVSKFHEETEKKKIKYFFSYRGRERLMYINFMKRIKKFANASLGMIGI